MILSLSVMDWLLEPADPGVRYLALRDLLHLPDDDPQLVTAREKAHRSGPIAEVMDAMHPDGYWVMDDAGYNPKYTSTVWMLSLLAQLGADCRNDARIATACSRFLDHSLTPVGQISAGGPGAPSGTVDCLQGNLSWALLALGCDDPRLELAIDWMARSNTGDGVAPMGDKTTPVRYYAGKCGPLFACGAHYKLPCAWGAVKVLLAFSLLPEERRTQQAQKAVSMGVDFLLDNHPESVGYPHPEGLKPSGSWWKFGFPVFYVTDVLQVAEVLAALGHRTDPRLAPLLEGIRAKANPLGHWLMEYSYAGKTLGDFGSKKAPSKWVTLRALRALEA